MYEKDHNDIIGLILAKDLIFVDPEVCVAVEEMIFGVILVSNTKLLLSSV